MMQRAPMTTYAMSQNRYQPLNSTIGHSSWTSTIQNSIFYILGLIVISSCIIILYNKGFNNISNSFQDKICLSMNCLYCLAIFLALAFGFNKGHAQYQVYTPPL